MIKPVKRSIFVLPEQKMDINLLANELNYSYISPEYALSYYQMIPDIVRVATSVSKNRHEKINNLFTKAQLKNLARDVEPFLIDPKKIKQVELFNEWLKNI